MKGRTAIRWAEAALRDVESIVDYSVARDGREAAGQLLDRIVGGVGTLDVHPLRCRAVPELRKLGISDFRELIVRQHRICFRIHGNDVVVPEYPVAPEITRVSRSGIPGADDVAAPVFDRYGRRPCGSFSSSSSGSSPHGSGRTPKTSGWSFSSPYRTGGSSGFGRSRTEASPSLRSYIREGQPRGPRPRRGGRRAG